MIKTIEDLQASNKTAVEDAMVSATAWNEGFQKIAGQMASFSQKAIAGQSKAVEDALSAPSVKDAVDMNVKFAATAYETYVSQLKELGELSLGVAQKAYAPYEARLANDKTKAASAAKSD